MTPRDAHGTKRARCPYAVGPSCFSVFSSSLWSGERLCCSAKRLRIAQFKPLAHAAGGFCLQELAVEPQTSADFSAASIDDRAAVRLFLVAEDAFAMQVRHATIECALGAAMAAGE